MEDLIKAITEKAGITELQAQQALEAVKNYVVDKFPMMAGAVEGLFNSQGNLNEDDGL